MFCRPTRILAAVLVCTALVALCGGMPVPARADGDPASDVLLGEDVFLPYTPQVSAPLQRTLAAETALARRAHARLKVALIASPVDLGVVPDLFGHPQKYAEFLDQEISFQHRQALLVVMPAGYGTQGLSPKATAAVAALAKPTGHQSNDLAHSAIAAVAAIAAADGHPVKGVSGVPGSGSGGSSSTLLILLAAAAVLTAAVLAAVTLRKRKPAG